MSTAATLGAFPPDGPWSRGIFSASAQPNSAQTATAVHSPHLTLVSPVTAVGLWCWPPHGRSTPVPAVPSPLFVVCSAIWRCRPRGHRHVHVSHDSGRTVGPVASAPAARGVSPGTRSPWPSLPAPPSGCQEPRSLTSFFGPAPHCHRAGLAPHRLALAWPSASSARAISSRSRGDACDPRGSPASPSRAPTEQDGRSPLDGSPCGVPRSGVGVTAGTGQPSCSTGRASGRGAALAAPGVDPFAAGPRSWLLARPRRAGAGAALTAGTNGRGAGAGRTAREEAPCGAVCHTSAPAGGPADRAGRAAGWSVARPRVGATAPPTSKGANQSLALWGARGRWCPRVVTWVQVTDLRTAHTPSVG